MPLSYDTGPQSPTPESSEDFENCKGQCGYTIWCRACMAETKKRIREAEQKERDHAEEPYD